MNYLLFHKNIHVLSFEYDVENSIIFNLKDVNNIEHIPVGIYSGAKKNFTANLNFWWRSRLVPESRKRNLPKTKFSKLVSQSYGFNLTDQYWIKPEDSDMTWQKGNFFLNSFSEDIGKFITKEEKTFNERMTSDSPDIFSNGEQDKRWAIKNGTRFLIKYGKAPYCQEPMNEVFASEICRRLGFSHVPYTFIRKGTKIPKYYSSCVCFVSENTEYVPAGFVIKIMKKSNSDSLYTHLIKCCEKLGMRNLEEIERQIAQMVFLDFITANVDRHFGNFGFIRNADSLEWEGMCPNFDSGNSMFFDQPTSILRNENYFTENVKCLSFARTQDEQLGKFADGILKLGIDFSKLNDIGNYFSEILSTNIYIDNERAGLLGIMAKRRTKSAMKLIYTKNSATKFFLNEIKENSYNQDFFAAVKKSKKDTEDKNEENKTTIDKYLEILTPENEAELKVKIEKDIAQLKATQKKPESPSKDDGIGM